MTTIHVSFLGSDALVPWEEFAKLVELARQSAEVELHIEEAEDWSTPAIQRLAVQGKAFDFWNDEEESIYSVTDGEPL